MLLYSPVWKNYDKGTFYIKSQTRLLVTTSGENDKEKEKQEQKIVHICLKKAERGEKLCL